MRKGFKGFLIMKKIIINSPKHGIHEVLVDDEDFEKVNAYKWSILSYKQGRFLYAATNVNGKIIRMHRYIFNVKDSKIMIDHADRNSLNNQKINLRICTYSENNINRVFINTITSKYKGVCWETKYMKWRTQIGLNKKKIFIGYFKTEIEAALAYNKKAKEIHGKFCVLNEI